MEQFTVTVDDGPDIRFKGERIALASTEEDCGRWMELALYRTAGGKFVCAQSHFTKWQGEADSHTATVCENHAGVIEFFGHDRLAKEIYNDAGIDAAIKVD